MLRVLEPVQAIAKRELYVWKIIPGSLLDPSRDRATDHETSSAEAARTACYELDSVRHTKS